MGCLKLSRHPAVCRQHIVCRVRVNARRAKNRRHLSAKSVSHGILDGGGQRRCLGGLGIRHHKTPLAIGKPGKHFS